MKHSYKHILILLLAFGNIIGSAEQSNAACTVADLNASFITSETNFCGAIGSPITLTNTSTGNDVNLATFEWYRNGVLIGTTNNPALPENSTLNAYGNFTFMLIADTGPCRDTAIINFTYQPVPSAAFSSSPANQCSGQTVSFTNSSTGTISSSIYTWNFGDGGSSSSSGNPGHTYANPGTYTATLLISNAGSTCTSMATSVVNIIASPVAAIAGDDGSGGTTNCLLPTDVTTSEVVTFSNTTTGAASYSWNFGDGSGIFNTASNASFNHTYNSYGTFNVVMTATAANGCIQTASLVVVFEKFVSASFTVPITETSGCAPHLVTPVNASVNANTYTWNFGDGTPAITTTNFNAPSHSYAVGGSYTISVTAANSCNTSTSTVGPILIAQKPIGVFNNNLAANLGCAPQSVTFTNPTTGVSPATNFYWDFGNGNTLAGVRNPPAQIYNQGIFTIMMVSGNGCGKDTIYRTIRIDTIPNANLLVNPTVGCTPLTVASSATATGGNLTYQWFVDGVFSYTTTAIPNQVFTAPAANATSTHSIRLRVSNQCGVDDETVPVVVHPLVQSIFTPLNSVICEGASISFTQTSRGTNLSYVWYFSNGNTSTAATPPAQTYPTLGTYTVSLVTTGFCGKDSATTTVTVNPIPATPTANDTTICTGTSATLSASTATPGPGLSFAWFSAPVGGVLLSSLPTYTTPILAVSATYYVQVTKNGCPSARKAVVVGISPIPPIPTCPGASICNGDTVKLNASSSMAGVLYNWYTVPAGGISIDSDSSYTTPALSATTTYYVQTNTLFGCLSPRLAVTVTVNAVPAPPTATAAPICAGNTVSITAAAGSATYQWFTSSTGGTQISSTANFTSGILNNDTTYFVQTTSAANCVSTRTAVTVTVNPIPNAPVVRDTIICANRSVTISGTTTTAGPGLTYSWFSVPAGGVALVSTQSYATPVLTSSATYYIQVSKLGCISPRTPLLVTVNPMPDAIFSNTTICLGDTTEFTDLSIGTGLTWQWTFGDGSNESIASPDHIYAAANTYSVKLKVVNNFLCADSVTQSVIVNTVPIANFTHSLACEKKFISFSDASIGVPVNWEWNFGDGTAVSNAQHPTHSFVASGTYTVQLIAMGGNACADTVSQNITVNDTPTSDFTFVQACRNESASFADASLGAPDTYLWYFGDATTDNTNNPNPNHTYTSSATFTVSLVTTYTATGCKDSISYPVISYARTTPSFTASTPCLNGATAFTNTSGGTPIDFVWNFGDGSATSSMNEPSHTYATANSFTVKLKTTNAFACADSISAAVTVNPLPVADFDFDTVCFKQNSTFTNLSVSIGGIASYRWNFGDGSPTSTAISPLHSFPLDGTYAVELIVVNTFGCSDTITKNVLVRANPIGDFSSSIVCETYTSVFTDNSNAVIGTLSWDWDFGDATAHSTVTSPMHLYSTFGTYNTTLITTNSFGCKDTLTKAVSVLERPQVDFTFNTACAEKTTNFVSVNSGGTTAWIWDFGDGSATTSGMNVSHSYTLGNTYTVQLIGSSGNACADTISHNVVVNPIPVADFTFVEACVNASASFTDASLGAPTQHVWYFGDGFSDNSNVLTPTHTYTSDGTFIVSLVSSYSATGCKDSISYAIDVFPRTVPAFTANTPCLNANTVFTNNTTGGPVSHLWDFGDASASNASAAPSHMYTSAATYSVKLVTTNIFSCKDSISQNVVVNPLPVASFNFDTVCYKLNTSFVNTTTSVAPIAGYAWNFGDLSATASSISPTHRFPLDGTYTVKLIATNSFGCKDSMSRNVLVRANPIADYTANTVCHTYTTSFTDAAVPVIGTLAWDYDFGDGSVHSNNASPTHVYPLDGTYNATLVATNSFGCKDTTSKNVTVLLQPQASFTYNVACARDAIAFDYTGTGASTTWQWNFGDATAFSAASDPTHIYATGNTYTIELITGNAAGCKDTLLQNIVVNTVPNPDFSATTVCLGNITNFTNLSNDLVAIGSNAWEFGDGNTSSATNPNYVYTSAGNFNVKLTVTNINGCDSSVTKPVIVNSIPIANFTADTVCAGNSTTFTDISSGTPVAWQWTFGDGQNSSNGPIETHNYAAPGNYFASLTVSGAGTNCNSQVFKTVVVSSTVVAAITAIDTVCLNTPVNFTNSSVINGGGAISYSWNFGDGSALSGSTSPSHTYSIAANITATLLATSASGCSSRATHSIAVLPLPLVDMTFQDACQNQATVINDASTVAVGQITAWLWDFGDGGSSTFQDPTHTFNAPGDFSVNLQVTSEHGCVNSKTENITIFPQPTASFTSKDVCFMTETKFTDASTISNGGVINQWTWDFEGGSKSNEQNPGHTFTAYQDSFAVKLFVQTDKGCKDSITKKVSIFPTVKFNYGPKIASGCEAFSSSFVDNSTLASGTKANWFWNFGDGNFGFTQNPDHLYREEGKYTVILKITTDKNCSYTDTLKYPIVVSQQPVAGFTPSATKVSIVNSEIEFIDQSKKAKYWDWRLGDGTTSSAPDNTHIYEALGTYEVTQIVYNEFMCSDTLVIPITVIDEYALYVPNAFTPNDDPHNDTFFAKGQGIVEFEMAIYDRWDNVVFRSSDINEGWDGKVKGGSSKFNDVYVYKIRVRDLNDEIHVLTGTVMVVR